ncbi:MAG TPA: hypothetical protein VF575_02520 [Candidatus Saccharimonadales bacterium]|jgi:hypothetical protein
MEVNQQAEQTPVYSYEHAGGQIYEAQSVDVARGMCPVLGGMSIKQAGLLLELEALGKELIASRTGSAEKVVTERLSIKKATAPNPVKITKKEEDNTTHAVSKSRLSRVAKEPATTPAIPLGELIVPQLETALYPARPEATKSSEQENVREQIPRISSMKPIEPASLIRQAHVDTIVVSEVDELFKSDLGVVRRPVQEPASTNKQDLYVEATPDGPSWILDGTMEIRSSVQKPATQPLIVTILRPSDVPGSPSDSRASDAHTNAPAQTPAIRFENHSSSGYAPEPLYPAAQVPVSVLLQPNESYDEFAEYCMGTIESIGQMTELRDNAEGAAYNDNDDNATGVGEALQKHKITVDGLTLPQPELYDLAARRAPKLPATIAEIQTTITLIIDTLDRPKSPKAQAIHRILQEIITTPANITGNKDSNRDSTNDIMDVVAVPAEADEQTAKQKIEALFVELFVELDIEYTPQLLESCRTLTHIHYLDSLLTNTAMNKAVEAPLEIGTREFLQKLQQSLQAAQQSMTRLYDIGRSILFLCGLQKSHAL